MNAEHNQKAGVGQLFIVATPIGNLDDITIRAVQTLKSVDLIAAEDTRHSRRLLQHYGITTPMFAYHEHNKKKAGQLILAKLLKGLDIALISDAGTPLISDPGYSLLSLLREQHISIVPVPGPCSIIAALSASGMPTDRYCFLGFIPKSGRRRDEVLETIGRARSTQILLESPKRLLKTLVSLKPYCPPPRKICVARELTKLHEEFVDGHVDEVLAHFQAKRILGEIILLIGPACPEKREISDEDIFTCLEADELRKLPPPIRAKEVARRLGVSRSRVYELATRLRGGKQNIP